MNYAGLFVCDQDMSFNGPYSVVDEAVTWKIVDSKGDVLVKTLHRDESGAGFLAKLVYLLNLQSTVIDGEEEDTLDDSLSCEAKKMIQMIVERDLSSENWDVKLKVRKVSDSESFVASLGGQRD